LKFSSTVVSRYQELSQIRVPVFEVGLQSTFLQQCIQSDREQETEANSASWLSRKGLRLIEAAVCLLAASPGNIVVVVVVVVVAVKVVVMLVSERRSRSSVFRSK